MWNGICPLVQPVSLQRFEYDIKLLFLSSIWSLWTWKFPRNGSQSSISRFYNRKWIAQSFNKLLNTWLLLFERQQMECVITYHLRFKSIRLFQHSILVHNLENVLFFDAISWTISDRSTIFDLHFPFFCVCLHMNVSLKAIPTHWNQVSKFIDRSMFIEHIIQLSSLIRCGKRICMENCLIFMNLFAYTGFNRWVKCERTGERVSERARARAHTPRFMENSHLRMWKRVRVHKRTQFNWISAITQNMFIHFIISFTFSLSLCAGVCRSRHLFISILCLWCVLTWICLIVLPLSSLWWAHQVFQRTNRSVAHSSVELMNSQQKTNKSRLLFIH